MATFVTLREFLLLEMPQLVEPTNFNFDDEQANRNYGMRLRSAKDVELLETLTGTFKLWRAGRVFFVNRGDASELYYAMRFTTKHLSIVNEVAATQVMVWTQSKAGPAVAKHVFFDYLLKEQHLASSERGLIATDRQQTDDGARFWKRRVEDALKKDLHVYLAVTVAPRSLTVIHDMDQLADLTPKIWGIEQKHQAAKLLISDHPLKPKSDVKLVE